MPRCLVVNAVWTELYRRLPPPLKSVAASLQGYRLQAMRYGHQTERLAAEALERDSWGPDRWRRWQEERLAFVLRRAATQVPYYRQRWADRRRRGDVGSFEILENWPLLPKNDLREQPEAFVADDCDSRKMHRDRTSGTTGTPLSVFATRSTIQAWYALAEARMRMWNGVSRTDRWAILGGQMVVPVSRRRPPYWVFNSGLNQLYLSNLHLSSAAASAYLEALCRFRPTHLLAYPSAAAVLAAAVLDQALVVPKLKVILTNAEPLTDSQRALLTEAFGCEVRSTYGMCEIVAGASECQRGSMHIWPEVGFLEVLTDEGDNAEPAPSGTVGRFAATSLLNADMPLVRYEVGDRGSVVSADRTCACGRTLPILSAIEGRTSDMVVTPTGRRVFWLNPVFYGLPLREGQIVQEALDRLRVKIVPTAAFGRVQQDAVVQRLRDRVGNDVRVDVELVSEIPRTPGGKFRPVVSHLGGTEVR